MELSCCSTIHFIQTIKNGTVVKISNLESEKKPSFVIKALKDIYKGSEHGEHGVSSKLKWKDTFTELALDDEVKVEKPCVPFVDRKTREIDYSDNEELVDLNFANTTLKQIKEKCKTKKRKQDSDCFGLSPTQECTKLEPEEDEFDLMEPLCIIKSRIVKNPKTKRKCIEKSVSPSSIILVPVKAEQITADNDFVQCTGDFLTVSVKVVDPLPEHSKNHIAEFGSANSSISLQQERSGEVLEEYKCDTQTVKSISITEQCGVVNILSHEDLEPTHDNNLEAVKNFSCEAQNVKPISMAEQYGICGLSSLSYEHLLPHDDTTEVDNQAKMEQDSTNVSQIKEEYLKHLSSNDDSKVVSSSQNQSNFEVQVSSGGNNDGASHCSSEPTKDLPSSNLSPSLSCESSVVADVDLQSPALNTIGGADTSSYSESKIFVDGDTKSQPVHLNEENNSSIDDDTISDLPTSEEWHLPERLPSKRKAIAPTSEERVRLSMNSMEADNETDDNKCKSGGNDGVPSDLTESLRIGEQLVLTKSAKPKEILKKWKKFRKGSPPKGNLEGSHSFPRFSSGCTSIQACSESAIAFSQRQMQDIEHLAITLMAELKSVKEIVEEKLLFEAYRNPSLKNEADEIKSIVKNATRAEVTSKKWLSLMARDCNRFCKIMKMKDSEPSTSSPENPIKKQKKITFADEAGGTLYQVKLFEDNVDSSVEFESESNESNAE